MSFPLENGSDGQEILMKLSIDDTKIDEKENPILPNFSNQTGNEELPLDLDSKETLGTTSIGGRDWNLGLCLGMEHHIFNRKEGSRFFQLRWPFVR